MFSCLSPYVPPFHCPEQVITPRRVDDVREKAVKSLCRVVKDFNWPYAVSLAQVSMFSVISPSPPPLYLLGTYSFKTLGVTGLIDFSYFVGVN